MRGQKRSQPKKKSLSVRGWARRMAVADVSRAAQLSQTLIGLSEWDSQRVGLWQTLQGSNNTHLERYVWSVF